MHPTLQQLTAADCSEVTDLHEFVDLSKQELNLADAFIGEMMGVPMRPKLDLWYAFLHRPTQEQVAKFQRIIRRLCQDRDNALKKLRETLSGIQDRLMNVQNFLDDGYFFETLKIGREKVGVSDLLLAKKVGRNATTMNNWRVGRGTPTVEDRSNILALIAEKASSALVTVSAVHHVQVFQDYAAILNRDRQDPEGDVNSAEPTSGGSGE